MTRGDIWWVDFGIPFGSEPGYKRPVVILQDDSFNKSKINTVIIAPITTNLLLAEAPGNVLLEKAESKLKKDSVVVVSQITAIDKERLIEKENKLSQSVMAEIESGMLLVLGLRK